MKNVLTLALLIALFSSCKKEENKIETNPEVSSGITTQSFLQTLQPQSQFFTIQTGSYSIITGDQGTVLQFSYNSFSPLSNGIPITIELREYYLAKDIIAGGLSTLSLPHNCLLSTSGMIFLKATLGNGTELPIRNFRLSFELNYQSSNMLLFSGTSSPSNPFSWNNFDADTLSGGPVSLGNDTINGNLYYSAFVEYLPTGLNWLNCDAFINYPNISTTVFLKNILLVNSVHYFVYFPSLNAIVSDYGFVSPYTFNYLPTGYQAKFGAISYHSPGTVNFGLKETTIDGSPVFLIMNPITEQQVIDSLAHL